MDRSHHPDEKRPSDRASGQRRAGHADHQRHIGDQENSQPAEPRRESAAQHGRQQEERALEFAILCVSRSNEVIGARRTEVDLGNAIWTVPPERMKKREEHRVPLSDAAIALLEALPVEQDNPFVFIGTRRDSINKMSLRLALHRIRDDCTVHGMRSSFRDWCGESTNFEREVAEQCLAHRIGDQTEQSYARGTMFDKRRRLMAAWSAFCCSSPVAAAGDNVVTLGGRP